MKYHDGVRDKLLWCLVLLLLMIMGASGNDICQTETYSQAGIDFPCSSTCSNLINGGDKDSLHNKNCKDLCPNCYEYQVSIQPTKPDPNLTTLPAPPVSVFTITPTTPVSSGTIIGIPIATFITVIAIATFIVGIIIGTFIGIKLDRKGQCKCMDRCLGHADQEQTRKQEQNDGTKGINQEGNQKQRPKPRAPDGNQAHRGVESADEKVPLVGPRPNPPVPDNQPPNLPHPEDQPPNPSDPGSSREQGPATADYNPEPSGSNEQASIKVPHVKFEPSMPDITVRYSTTQPGEDSSIESRQARKTCTDSYMEEIGIPRGHVEHPTSITAEVHEDPKVVEGQSAAYSNQVLDRLPQHVSDHDQQTHVKVHQGMRRGIVQDTASDADGAKSLVEEEDTSIGPRKTCTDDFIAGLGIHSSGDSEISLKDQSDDK